MTKISTAESNVLIALTIEAFRDSVSPPDVFEVVERYHLHCDQTVLQAVISALEEDGLLSVLRNGNNVVAASPSAKFLAGALPRVLHFLSATEFSANWRKEEILTDADPSIDFPSLEGWKVFYFDSDCKEAPTTQPSALPPIQITNTFSPINNVTAVGERGTEKRDKSGWWNFGAAILIGAISIVVTLWVSGKL